MFQFFKFINKLENKTNKKTKLLPPKPDEFGHWMITRHVGNLWKSKTQLRYIAGAFYHPSVTYNVFYATGSILFFILNWLTKTQVRYDARYNASAL